MRKIYPRDAWGHIEDNIQSGTLLKQVDEYRGKNDDELG
jgi:hypothetical protein